MTSEVSLSGEAGARTLPAFGLEDLEGTKREFPAGRHALLCFVKEDCPTCALSMPLIEAAHRAFADGIDVWAIGQDGDGNQLLVDRYALTVPMLDDSALKVSYAFEFDTVPTVFFADREGRAMRTLVGFDKADWLALFRELAEVAGTRVPAIDWQSYPEQRPGCGSRSVEPGIAERLAAEAEGSPLRARRIEIGSADDVVEFMFDQGLTDGLPVVPPTPERVLHMLTGTRRDPQEVVAVVPPNLAPVTVEKIAINAVMAGCKPEYLPVVIAAIEAICTNEFNIHGVLATTHFVGPILIVNGPIRQRIGMNSGINALGQGNRANATIGRAVQLVVRNVGGGRPGEVDRAALGQPGKYTFCFAENEERSNWEPLHVERGFRPEESTVTVFAGGAPALMADQLSRGGRSLATSYGLALSAVSHPKQYNYGELIVVVPPEHVDTFARENWSKNQIREQIQQASRKPVRELVQSDECAEGLPREAAERLGMDTTMLSKFREKEHIKLVVAGGEAGKFAAVIHGWVSGPTGSIMTTRRIDE